MPQNQKACYLRAVLEKLRGAAKNCTYGQTFAHLKRSCSHLKQRFAPGKGFAYYDNKLHALSLKQKDTVGGCKDQISILLSCARAAFSEEKKAEYHLQDDDPTD